MSNGMNRIRQIRIDEEGISIIYAGHDDDVASWLIDGHMLEGYGNGKPYGQPREFDREQWLAAESVKEKTAEGGENAAEGGEGAAEGEENAAEGGDAEE